MVGIKSEVSARRCRRPFSQRKVHCALCDKAFSAKIPHERICKSCKSESELYRFSGWLPDVDDELMEEIGCKLTG